MSSSSHHLPANLPNAGIERGGEHGSFMSGHEASPSMKGCLLGMNLRCVVPVRHSARDMCSTLPARRVDRRRFTRHVTRMYLLCQNASRDSHRVLTGPWRRRVRRDPSSRHSRALPEAAGKGTRAWTASRPSPRFLQYLLIQTNACTRLTTVQVESVTSRLIFVCCLL